MDITSKGLRTTAILLAAAFSLTGCEKKAETPAAETTKPAAAAQESVKEAAAAVDAGAKDAAAEAKDAMAETETAAKDAGADLKDAAKDAASTVTAAAKDAGDKMTETATAAGDKLGGAVAAIGDNAKKGADDAAGAVGGLLGGAKKAAEAAAEGRLIQMDNGLKIVVKKEGTGATATKGSTVFAHYTGRLNDANGVKFDSSRDRNEPFSFPLGAGRVIKGWDFGIEGMKVGEVRELTIPADLGYGSRGAGGAIPPGATLWFEVELIDVK